MSEAAAVLEFEQVPSATAGYLRALLKRSPGLKRGKDIPRIEARVANVRASARQVRQYRKLCGFSESNSLPLTFPHILAAPLHLAVITHPKFPLKLLGAVHVRNQVKQKRALAVDEVLELQVSVEGHREVEQGIEFDLVTKVIDAKGSCPWESVSTNLIRRGQKKSGGKAWTPPDWSLYHKIASWRAKADIGVRYGTVAGDLNPIHLHALTARLFGFPRAIAHGMWSFGRCAAAIMGSRVPQRCELDVAFKRPLLLPGTAELLTRREGKQTEYLLVDPKRETMYLSGSLKM
jgi:hypothetical protein